MKRETTGSLFAVLLSVLYFVNIEVNMFTFHFVHNNVFHLCANLIALSYIYKKFDWRLLPLAYIICSISWLITQNAAGVSAIIFFMWGTILLGDMGRMNNKSRVIYLLGIAATFSFSTFMPISFALHFVPFVLGFMVGVVKTLVVRFNNDIKGVL